ncbi:MAG: Asp/Glu racemase [Cellvibrionaceae bacterium]|nr:Asp/Glu racemase [Cellvibrionaceae bacterium]
MTDVLGYRAKFGVLGPATNTTVEPEFEAMRPAGVTNHYSRIYVENANAISDESFMSGTMVISENTLDAVRHVMPCAPDYLVMGMSAVTFYGGAEGCKAWKKNIEDCSGLRISVGSESVAAALAAYGGIKKIAFMSPYYPVANREVANFFSDYGYETLSDVCLKCPTWTAIAEVSNQTTRNAFYEINSDQVDAIIQVGTNLSAVNVAADMEVELGKPVIAINTATYWHALRAFGIPDRLEGAGRLLKEF